ncbi:hypothetical protein CAUPRSCDRAFT_12094 [Caulochytrium protostelioides]|uniref:Uncharacterized protein n=1 Tax=Caulochytrium protostelioides TaxID=1555241 RepID=A0A4P9WU45_9FUNG|nr:hypothetical protein CAUPRSCDRAFT_12094 [Caulochytrium protostelioides]
MQMNIRGLGLLPILLLASLMCWAVTAVPTDPGQSLQSINVPHSNVDHPEPWPPRPLPTVPELHIRYGKALSEAFKLRESDGSFKTYDEFFAAVLYPFYSTHEAIGPGNVTPEKPNLFVYFDFFNELDRNVWDANQNSNQEYKMPLDFQHFAKYRVLLENLREMKSPFWVHDLHQQFHKNLATLELTWLYAAVSLYYHSSDLRIVDSRGLSSAIVLGIVIPNLQMTKMQSTFNRLLPFEESLRKLLGEVYRDLPAAQSENGPVATSLLQKVLEHISSDDWKHFAVASSASVPLREKLKTHCQNANDWIDGVQNMGFPQNIDEWRMRLAGPSEVHEDAGPMITTLQKLLGKVINPLVPKHAEVVDQESAPRTRIRPKRTFQQFYGDELISFFAPPSEIMAAALTHIEDRLSKLVRSTLSGVRFQQNLDIAVKEFHDHVRFLETLSPYAEHFLLVRAMGALEDFDGSQHFDYLASVSGQHPAARVYFEEVTRRSSLVVSPGMRDTDVFPGTVPETTQISPGVGNIANTNGASSSSIAAQPHSQHLPISTTGLRMPGTTSHPAAGQSFSTLMDHFRYP